MRGKVQVFDAVLDYSVTSVGETNWVPVGGPITQNFVRCMINDSSGAEFEIGYGGPGQSGPAYVAQRAFRLPPGGGEFHQIFNSGMQMFIRLINAIGGTNPVVQGRIVINGFY